MKNVATTLRAKLGANMGKAAAAVSGAALLVGTQAQAAIDVAGVGTEITNAEASAHSIGTIVIGVVASLAVVGIVISLVRKL